MKKMWSVIPAVLVLLSACQSPETRIKKNLSQFQAYPPAIQEKIRAGRIDTGFSPEMVLMAKGEPDRKYHRPSKGVELDVWAYFGRRPEIVSTRPVLGPNQYPIDRSDIIGTRSYEKTRVIFKDGKVMAVEELPDPGAALFQSS